MLPSSTGARPLFMQSARARPMVPVFLSLCCINCKLGSEWISSYKLARFRALNLDNSSTSSVVILGGLEWEQCETNHVPGSIVFPSGVKPHSAIFCLHCHCPLDTKSHPFMPCSPHSSTVKPRNLDFHASICHPPNSTSLLISNFPLHFPIFFTCITPSSEL